MRGRRWAAAGFTWQAQYKELPGCLSRGRHSTQSLLKELRRAWAPLGAAGPRLASRGRRSTELPGCLSRGRRSTQSLLKELRRAWARLGRGWLHVAGAVQGASWLPFAWQAQYTEPSEGAAAREGAAGPRLASRGRRSTESFLAAFRVAGAVHRASWRSCGAGAAGPRLAFVWQAQYTEPPEGVAARVGAGGLRLASRGRRSIQSLLKGAVERASWLLRAGAVHRASWRSCGVRVHSATFSHI